MHPIDYPSITLGGRAYVVRYSLAAQIILVRSGIDPMTLGTLLAKDEPRHVEYLIRLFAACVAENFIDHTRPYECDLRGAWTADYWMSVIQLSDIPAIDKVCGVSMGKATEALKNRATDPPPQ